MSLSKILRARRSSTHLMSIGGDNGLFVFMTLTNILSRSEKTWTWLRVDFTKVV